ncbi:sel1 repeat family protein [Terrimonas sp. NA20]|uniref:Sel1 repeat family protein n=1 Tax=Terrimonas ginsenosidimutans TaxID=2908004 RepID=A0ABS9KMD4_9BACT|nr:tetratricopeptide repeat protein [Terrimonas ginsenosidimutans]MCG2613469.1 sel1 repeat family protein [Terrimonas ginsenosidimutans]
MKPHHLFTTCLFFLTTLSNPASAQDDYVKELEANFKNVLSKLSNLTGNTDPSILFDGSGQHGKYATKLVVIPGASHTIDFSGSTKFEYQMEAPLEDSAKSRAYFNFFASLGQTHIAPNAFTIEYKVSDGQPSYTWVGRTTAGNKTYQNTFVIWAKTQVLSGKPYYYTNMRVTKKECDYLIREGMPVNQTSIVSYATLIKTLSDNLGSRFRKLSRFAKENDSTEFRPAMLLEEFTNGKTEKHTIYNNFWGYKDQLKYEATKYFPDNEKAAESFFHHVAETLNAVFNKGAEKATYADNKSLKYEWLSDSLPFKVSLNYYAEGLFPRQVSFVFVSSPDQIEKLRFRKTQLMAEKGDATALVDLGFAYFSGNNVPKDLNKAMNYFKDAADKGQLTGIVNMGIMHYYGHGVRIDEKKGLQWYKKAADLRSPAGMYRVGLAYFEGKAVRKNVNTAIDWYKQAADSNYAPAIIALGSMYKEGNGVAFDAASAMYYYKKVVALGDKDAIWQMGDLYESKLNRMDSAVYWYQQAVDKDYSWGMSSLGRIHYLNKEYQKALQLFNKGAELKNSSCMYFKGLIYENGYGVTKDMVSAKSWYRAAANLGHSASAARLKEIDAKENPVINRNTDWDEY